MANSNNSNICSLHTPGTTKHLTHFNPWYCDRVNVTKFSYLWKIENFKTFEGEAASPQFGATAPGKIKWQLVLSKVKQLLILKLKLVASDKPRIKFNFNGSVLNAKAEVAHSMGKYANLHTASPNDVFIFLLSLEARDVLDESKRILIDDTLSIACDINVIIDAIDTNPWQDADDAAGKANESILNGDLYKLLETGKFSDVSFVTIDGTELHAHKAILSIRSEVFAAMFDHAMMEEHKSNQVSINDVSKEVFREMLTFIYSNESPNIDEMAFELLAVADKYALKKLKSMCEFVLDRDLSVSNALQTLVLAERHCSDLLRVRSIHFIKANMTVMMETEEWQIMTKEYSHLVEAIECYNGCI